MNPKNRKAMWANKKKIQGGLYYMKNEDDAQEMMNMYFDDNNISKKTIDEGKLNSFQDTHNNKEHTIIFWRQHGKMKIQVGFPNSYD
jgi:hypothetical protein